MKFLLIFLLSFSAFAGSGFEGKKELSLKKLRESGTAAPQDIECVEKAEDRKTMNNCYKAMSKEPHETKLKSKAKEAAKEEEKPASTKSDAD